MTTPVPCGLYYSAAELGLDDILVAAGGFVESAVRIPMALNGPVSRISGTLVRDSGTAATAHVIIRPYDFDDATALKPVGTIVSAIAPANASVWGFSVTSDFTYASNGSVVQAEIASIAFGPYLAWGIQNADGANAGNFSLRVAVFYERGMLSGER